MRKSITKHQQRIQIVFVASFLGAASAANAGLVFEQVAPPVQQQAKTPGLIKGEPAAGMVGQFFPNRQLLSLDPNLTPYIIQAGEKPKTISVLSGSGRSVNLVAALRQIVPTGWKVFSDATFNESQLYSWSGNKQWIVVLNSLLQEAGLKAYIDWSSNEITLVNYKQLTKGGDVRTTPPDVDVRRAAPVTSAPTEKILSRQELNQILAEVEKKTSISSVSSSTVLNSAVAATKPQTSSSIANVASTNSVIPAHGGNVMPVVQIKSAAEEALRERPLTQAPVERLTWMVDRDLSIKQNLEKWASSIGWRVVWSARTEDHIYDYSSEAFDGIQFKGELMGAKGVMARVIATFIDSNPPLKIEFFKANKIAEVSIYKRNGMAPLPEATKDGLDSVNASAFNR